MCPLPVTVGSVVEMPMNLDILNYKQVSQGLNQVTHKAVLYEYSSSFSPVHNLPMIYFSPVSWADKLLQTKDCEI